MDRHARGAAAEPSPPLFGDRNVSRQYRDIAELLGLENIVGDK
jgi:hypothetical protein